ncbi:unnamed protein product [Cuscuta epithymum]|uniref:Vacuolar membrane protease n=1 Tax=Cuscuta epithymum TaxID=186058 RepID=A0AAV0BXV8_9ASTE|nr:unnamed protein product [Cuscuta epithymum]
MGGERRGAAYELLFLIAFIALASWVSYHLQVKVLPQPLTAEVAGESGFSEVVAFNHLQALARFGPHHLGSIALDHAVQYVLEAAETIKEEADEDVEVEVELFKPNSGVNNLFSGRYFAKTLVYADLKHVLIRVSPRNYAPDSGFRAQDNAILVSSHIDTVFSAEGAGDDSSNVAVMLELARALSHQARGFKNSIIFFFNTGEEEGLDGSHSFITQHPWVNTIRVAINLEAMGIGGKSGIFQAGSDPWAIQNFAKAAKYPTGQIISQDLFSSGIIQSSTDFQVYQEIGGLSGLDFAFTHKTAVYHTKNDKVELLKPGSLQHLGENMLPFLLRAAKSSDLPQSNATLSIEISEDTVVYFDILGKYMMVYSQTFADMINKVVIVISIVVWTGSLTAGGMTSVISMAFSLLSIVAMWICSIGFSLVVAFSLPLVSQSPVPFIASPWLVIGLFASPALLGSYIGQHVAYLLLHKFLSYTYTQTEGFLPLTIRNRVAELHAERWMFKTGLLQWLLVLSVGNSYKIGSSYLALVWMVSPAIAYGLLEALARSNEKLNPLTLMIGLTVPIVVSSGVFVQLVNTLIGSLVQFGSSPGTHPDWMGSVLVAVLVAATICLTMVYLLPYIHNSGAKSGFIVATCILFGISFGMVQQDMVPPFTCKTVRAVNVVQVINATGNSTMSHISLFSSTPGNLDVEAENLGEGFVCGRDRSFDFVTFKVKYSCWTNPNAEHSLKRSQIPELRHVTSDIQGDTKTSVVNINTSTSSRWCLSINTDEVEDFQLEDGEGELISLGEKNILDGWHLVQFAGGRNAPREFKLTLYWRKMKKSWAGEKRFNEDGNLLLKLRVDYDQQTPEMDMVFKKLPRWVSQLGKSTLPFALAYYQTISVAETMGVPLYLTSE